MTDIMMIKYRRSALDETTININLEMMYRSVSKIDKEFPHRLRSLSMYLDVKSQ